MNEVLKDLMAEQVELRLELLAWGGRSEGARPGWTWNGKFKYWERDFQGRIGMAHLNWGDNEKSTLRWDGSFNGKPLTSFGMHPTFENPRQAMRAVELTVGKIDQGEG